MDGSSQRRFKGRIKEPIKNPIKGQILVEFMYFALVLVGLFFFVLFMGQKTLKAMSAFQF